MKYVKLALSFVQTKLLALWALVQCKVMTSYLTTLEKLVAYCEKFVAENEGKGNVKSFLTGPVSNVGAKLASEVEVTKAELVKSDCIPAEAEVPKEEEK